MAVRVDYHMHLRKRERPPEQTDYRVEAVEAYVETARSRGVDEIGVSEHVYYFRDVSRLWFVDYTLERSNAEFEEYVEPILEAKRRGLPVKLGLEVDWIGDAATALDELLAPYPWDFFLVSVHWIDGEAVDMEPGLWARASVEEVWRRYFRALCDAARSGLYDVLSHPDLAKIFGRRPGDGVVTELHEELAAAAAEGGVAVEVSSAGLHKPVGEIYPDRALLEACRRRGVPITLASDAHYPELPGRDLDRCVDLARAVGYETVTVFDRRHARQEPLS